MIAVAVLAPSSASYEKLVSEDPAVTLPPQNTGDYSSTGFLIAVIAVSLAWSAAISAANVFGFGYSSNQLPSAAIFIDAFLSFALLSGASASSGMLSGLREAGFAFCTLVGNKSSGFCAKIIAGIFFSFVGWIAHVASLLKNLQVRYSPPVFILLGFSMFFARSFISLLLTCLYIYLSLCVCILLRLCTCGGLIFTPTALHMFSD